jgi:hypothetical protein
LPDHSFAAVSEGMQHTLYKGMIAPLALLGGLVVLARRSVKIDDADRHPTMRSDSIMSESAHRPLGGRIVTKPFHDSRSLRADRGVLHFAALFLGWAMFRT